ncbi:MAG: carboxypeptidase regulatory-like domain-containing protein [Acidobacteria bacterium]|nr:MAG: carboxypeptidase regulatory-like domain-containing protein [Acidobacteriota bacterium]REK01716.1 MAG: carboxypeptidase regulatory-like domain-containing protein [Acidobacteriota bacterium]REK14672.1 MAG: carboxypeptidase regulatory-like domain-containing protein [Acidobacteriota bacterium]REK45387.1 MAG: carboxypeptidase regulatory-like domain-containing protein [Acidobacteriota bacterium]
MNTLVKRIPQSLAVFTLVAAFATTAVAQIFYVPKGANASSPAPILKSAESRIITGENGVVYGSRFVPNEAVVITIMRPDAAEGLAGPYEYASVSADLNGNFVYSRKLDVRGTHTFTAKGAVSGIEVSSSITSGGGGPTPKTLSGHKSCADINAKNSTFPTITSDYGFRIREWGPTGTFPLVDSSDPYTFMTGGAPEDPENSVTTSSWYYQRRLAWSSTRPITAVIVTKLYGSHRYSNVYIYDPASMGDNGPLRAPYDQKIYSVEFCFDEEEPDDPMASLTVVKQAFPASNFQFEFLVENYADPQTFDQPMLSDTDPAGNNEDEFNSKQYDVENFSGPVSITESNPAPYTLTGIVCVDNNNGGAEFGSYTVDGNTADVSLSDGDDVTCTFTNDFVTAVEAVVTGRVLDANGTPISGAGIMATDGNGNTKYAITNQFGYYTIRELEAGTSLYMEVSHKRYTFPTRFVELNEGEMTIDFQGVRR